MKTLSFFGENGLTSTSANHIANLAKEAVRNAHEKLAAARFYTEEVGLLTSSNKAIVRKGWDEDVLDMIPGVLNTVIQANSLIAYLREAIKEKERKEKEAQQYMDVEAREANTAKFGALVRPVKASYPTEEQIKQTWSVGEQEKYLSLEAEAAALGKFIHEDGHFSNARIDLMSKIQNPSRVDVKGTETVVYSYTPTVDIEEVDEMFNMFQKRYREVQAELNGMKKRVQDTLDSEKLRIDQEYAKAKREYDLAYHALENELNEIENQEEIRKKELLMEVRDLKIVIPNRLRPLYEKLNGMK